MTRHFARLCVCLALLGSAACDDDKGTGPVIPAPSSIVTAGSVPETGAAGIPLAEPLSVRVLDAEGAGVSGIEVGWTVVSGGGSLSTTSSTTNATGEASTNWTLGTAAGENVARAEVGSLTPVVFTVHGEPGRSATIIIMAAGEAVDTLAFTQLAGTRQLSTRVWDVHGNEIASPALQWSIADTLVATVDAEGIVTARGAGQSQIMVRADTALATATVRVTQTPASVVVTPAAVTLSKGDTQQFLATVLDAGGSPIPNAAVAWNSSDPLVASVTGSGLLTAIGEGAAALTAASGVVSRTASVIVKASVTWELAFSRQMNLSTFQIYLMNSDGSGVRALTEGAISRAGPTWSPDGSKIAHMAIDRIYIMNADGTGATPITPGGSRFSKPSWSPDGSKFATTIANYPGDRVVVMNTDGSGQTFLTTGQDGNDASPGWSPDGSKIAFVRSISGNWWIHTMNSDGTDVRRLAWPAPQLCNEYSWSPDGTRLIASCTNDQIYILYADGTTPSERLTDGTGEYRSPVFSPDGSMIVFFRYWEEGGLHQIYIMNADGTGVRRISDGTANDFDSAWRPQPKP